MIPRTTLLALAASAIAPALTPSLAAQVGPLAGDANRPILLSPPAPAPIDKIAIVSIEFPAGDLFPLGHFIDEPTQVALADGVELLVANNSYGTYLVDVHPDTTAPEALYSTSNFRVVMPQPVEYYLQETGSKPTDDRIFTVAFLVDVVDRMKQTTPIDLDDYKRVAVYLKNRYPPEHPLAGTPIFGVPGAAVGRFGTILDINHAKEVAVWHELTHTFNMGHAHLLTSAVLASSGSYELWPEIDQAYRFTTDDPEQFKEYGDCFDYMGLGWGGCSPRISTECMGTMGTCPDEEFADLTDIHTNPVNKWQHGWLPDSAIKVVTATAPPETITIESIASPTATGVRAVEIPLGPGIGGATARSLFVYYRGNEDKVKTGASLAYFTRESSNSGSRLVRFERGTPVIATNPCEYGPVEYRTAALPGEESDLQLYEEFYDPDARATIYVESISEGTSVDVTVTWDESAVATTNDHVPILNLISPDLEPGKIVSDEVVTVEIEAFDPDHSYPPGGGMWGNIDEVLVTKTVGNEDPVTFPAYPPFSALPAPLSYDPQSGRLTLSLDLTMAAYPDIQKTGYVRVDVFSHIGAFNWAKLNFLLDNFGPSPGPDQ